MTEKRKSWIWIFSTFLLAIVVVLLSITIGVVGLDKDGDTLAPYPIGPGTEIKTGKYQYITYIEKGKINDENNDKSLINTVEYLAFDEEGNLVEQDIKVIDEQLGDFLISNEADYGWNIFSILYDIEGNIENIQHDTPTIGDFVKAVALSFDTKGYLYLGDYKYNTWYKGGKLSITEDGYAGFFFDVVGEGYDAATKIHDFGILFNWNWGMKDYSDANFGATITATMFFGNLDKNWTTIDNNNGDLSFLQSFLYKEIISFYLDDDGHAELYNKNDNIIIKGDFDFMNIEISDSITIPPVNIPGIGEVFPGVSIPKQLSAYVGFNQDEESNAQETTLNQDYVVKIDITPSWKIITWKPYIVFNFSFDFQFLKIPHVFNHNQV